MKNSPLLLKIIRYARLFWRKSRRYKVVVFIVLVLGLYSFLVFRIGALSQVEPDEATLSQQLSKTKRLKIDQDSVDKIQRLEEENIGVQSIFNNARNNPFQE